MSTSFAQRAREVVTITSGESSLIGRAQSGKVGLPSKRVPHALSEGERWLVEVVHDTPNYFIFLPIERVERPRTSGPYIEVDTTDAEA